MIFLTDLFNSYILFNIIELNDDDISISKQKIIASSEILFGHKIHLKVYIKTHKGFNKNKSRVMNFFFILLFMFLVLIVKLAEICACISKSSNQVPANQKYATARFKLEG